MRKFTADFIKQYKIVLKIKISYESTKESDQNLKNEEKKLQVQTLRKEISFFF